MTIRDNEDRGFYTETFHSSAWIYQGDDVGSGAIPPSLNARTRVVSSKLDEMSSDFVILQENLLYSACGLQLDLTSLNVTEELLQIQCRDNSVE